MLFYEVLKKFDVFTMLVSDTLPDQQNLEQFDVAVLGIPGPKSQLSGMSLIFHCYVLPEMFDHSDMKICHEMTVILLKMVLN